MKSRIMYIEQKSGGSGAFIGRVTFSKTGKTIYYKGKELARTSRGVASGNYYEVGTGGPSHIDFPNEYWISGPKKDGSDRLHEMPVIHIDEDVREEYWLKIRNKPECVNVSKL